MFLPDTSFKSIILQELNKDDRSISSLYRSLVDEGYKVHRLVLTGYLMAMEDMSVLRSKDIPPSKVYSISMTARKDIYESIGERCRGLEVSERKKPAIALYIFQNIFKRPIFLWEMRRAGFNADIDEVAARASNEDRAEAKRMLAKRGHKLPHRDPAYTIDQRYEKEYREIILHLLLERFEASSLSLETKQTKLGL